MFEAVFDLAKAVVPVNCHLLLLNLLWLEGEKITLQQMKGGETTRWYLSSVLDVYLLYMDVVGALPED